MHERFGHIFLLFLVDERHQRMCGTIGIPKREGSIIGKIALIYLAIRTTIIASDIAEHRGGCHRVIHRRIENRANSVVFRINGYLTQFLVPSSISSSYSSLEIPTWEFGLHVGLRIVDAGSREGTFHQHWFRNILDGYDHNGITLLLLDLHRRREFSCEEHMLIFCPTL